MTGRVHRGDGTVAVVLCESREGWSSTVWHLGMQEWCVFAPEVVDWIQANKPGEQAGLEAIAEARWHDDRPNCEGWRGLSILWVPFGHRFYIDTDREGGEYVKDVPSPERIYKA